jgi:hypothetical protein
LFLLLLLLLLPAVAVLGEVCCGASVAAAGVSKTKTKLLLLLLLLLLLPAVAVLGEVCSGASVAAAGVSNAKKLPIISPSSTSPSLSQADFFFRVVSTTQYNVITHVKVVLLCCKCNGLWATSTIVGCSHCGSFIITVLLRLEDSVGILCEFSGNAKKLPIISPSSTSPSLSQADFFFRVVRII